MLKMTAIGNLTSEIEVRTKGNDERPYAILRIASDRRYKAKDGSKLTEFISIKVWGTLAENCALYLGKGDRIAATGDFETVTVSKDDGSVQTGFLVKAHEVEFLSVKPKKDITEETLEIPEI